MSERDPGRASTCTFAVSGMDCSSCAQSVEKALRGLEGVEDARADVIAGRVTVRYAEGRVNRGDLFGAVRRVGYRVEEPPAPRTVYEVAEMDGSEAVRRMEERLASVAGIERLGFDIVRRRLSVEGEVASEEVGRALADIGMRARELGADRVAGTWWERRGRLFLAVVSGVLWFGSLLADQVFAIEGLAAPLAIGAIVAGGWYIVPRGVRAAMTGSLDMNFLMSIAAFGALIIAEYGEAASAMFLFAVAQLLETYSMDRARNAIRGLMDLSPAEATVIRGGVEERVPVDRVGVGEVVVVRPGEKIPVDGEVVAGRSAVNQAPITGESVPVDKTAGAEVFAGTLNGAGALEIRSSRPASDSTLARIIHSVEEAQATRAPSQTFVDRFARVYTPAVVAVAALVFVVPPLAGLGGWGDWFYRALVLLVVACPCALVISTPVTVVSALAGAARRGILIKGGLHLENAGRANVVAIDKTGTLTVGEPSVVEVVGFDGAGPHEVLALAAAAELRSEHPVGRAIVGHARAVGLTIPDATDTVASPGLGVRARVDGRIVHVGSERMFADVTPGANGDRIAAGAAELAVGARAALEAFAREGRTAVLVGVVPRAVPGGPVNGSDRPRVVGAIAVADLVRPHADDAVRDLREAGVERVVMLTGDNRATGRAVAERVGIDDYRAELLPDDKVAAVHDLRVEYGRVLMVGDGINDAPALAAADVGVAMGSAGTDVALETADIALMADDLSKLATTIRLARKAERIIRANIAFALLTKAVFVALAVAGVATLWMAVFADMGASLLVILNGLRAMGE